MDITASTWTEDDNANIAAAPDGAPEGMAPSGVNNVLRAHQGAIKRWYGWTTPRQTSGNAGSYLLAYGVGPSALVDGMTHLVQFHAANAGAATLSIQGMPALPLHYFSAGLWRPVPPALWGDGELFPVAYHANSGALRLVQLRNRTGEIHAYAGTEAPAGALLCAGQSVSRTLYAGLFAALGTFYGNGDGVSTFALPDLRDRTAIGKGDMGGTAANRVTSALSGLDTTLLGAAGGAQSRTASVSVTGTASGTLGLSIGTAFGGTQVFASGGGGMATGYDHAHAGSATGSLTVTGTGTTGAFSSLQPGLVLNYIIRT